MKKHKAKKKLISCLKDLTYDQLVSVVDWSKVAKYKMLGESSDETYEDVTNVGIQPLYGCPVGFDKDELRNLSKV